MRMWSAHHFPTLGFFPTLRDHGGRFQVHSLEMSGMHWGYHGIPKHVHVQMWKIVIKLPKKNNQSQKPGTASGT